MVIINFTPSTVNAFTPFFPRFRPVTPLKDFAHRARIIRDSQNQS